MDKASKETTFLEALFREATITTSTPTTNYLGAPGM